MMKQAFLAACVTHVLLSAAAQGHTDIQFWYDNEMIHVAPPDETSPLVFGSEFPIEGIEQQFATLPGIASETDVGLGIGPGDEIVYNVLGNLFYWDGVGFVPPAEGFEIRVRNNPPTVPDTFIGAETGVQPGSLNPLKNRIGAADDVGDFHVDLQWFLEPNEFPEPAPDTAHGAYGVKLSLSTSAPGIDDSAPLMFAFNLGLDDPSFEEALDAFAALLAPGLPGDFDQDGDVDVDDFQIWREGCGIEAGAALADGDADGDADVDAEDFLIWQANFGAPSAAASASVPEPGLGVLLAMAGCAAMLASLRFRWEKDGH